VLLKLLNVEESNFEHEFAQQMKAKKVETIPKIINKLVGKESGDQYWVEDENLNACMILMQLLDVTDFFRVIAKRSTIQKLSEIAFDPQGSKLSQNCARQVLERLVQKINEKGRGGREESSLNQDDDEDTIITKGDSDEDEEGVQGVDPQVLETLSCLIPKIHQSITSAMPAHI
jgi:hypothetical protein